MTKKFYKTRIIRVPQLTGQEVAFYQACMQHSRPPDCRCPQYGGEAVQLPPGKEGGWSRNEVTSTSQEKSANQTSSNNHLEPDQNETIESGSIEAVSTNNYSKHNALTDSVTTLQNLSKEQVSCQPRVCRWYQSDSQISRAIQKLEKLSQEQNDDKNFNKIQSNVFNSNHSNNESSKLEDEFYFFGLNVAAQMRKLPLNVALKLQTKIQRMLCLRRIKDQKDNSTTLDHTNSLEPQSTKSNSYNYVAELQDDDRDPDDDFDLLKEDNDRTYGSQ
ncbi:uncharacterized protein LOC113236333 isoform X2 [Hyposmocoma kahamanoa]|uniref:uncharacterized protein LOC113236333 isoform X2 n=1 Tax=Hyposmocoma kahamanoa TaxID=1477025 RepID=UPI000E6DA315|nr:uncharacterized protein LOC113236333 isoform X2 [Hyposmocoma kahamanoa]